MKRFLAMLVAVVLVLSLAACVAAKNENRLPTDAATDAATDAGTDATTNPPIHLPIIPAGNQPTEDVTDAPDAQLSRGSISGNVYTSAFSGLRFQAPELWSYADDEQIAQTMNVGMEILGNDIAFNKAATELANICDVMVTGPDGSNINILYENLALTNGLGYSEEEYLQVVKTQLEALTEIQYAVSQQITTVELCGHTYYALTANASFNAVDMVQTYYVRRVGNYMINVITTSVGQTTPADIEACFG